MKVLVMGAGAIGCFVGGSLALAGHDVTLVGRRPLQKKIANEGLTIRRPDHAPQKISPLTITSLTDASDDYDFILLTVKTPDVRPAAQQLKILSPTPLVSLQNGVGSEEILADIFGPDQIIAGTITIPIQVPALGIIEMSKLKGGLGLASLTSTQPIQALADALTQAGLPTPTYPDYRAMKWSKLLLNIVNNATSAILNQPPAQIIENPELFNLEIEALREGVTIMQAQNISAVKLPGYPVDWLARLIGPDWLPFALSRTVLRPFMLSGRGTKMPSLQIDLAAGRETTEINHLNGAIVKVGQKRGIPTPVNLTLVTLLNGLAAGRLDWKAYQNRPEKLLNAIKKNRLL